jgi:hypothetical protein
MGLPGRRRKRDRKTGGRRRILGEEKEMMNKDTNPFPILKTCVSDVRRMVVDK